jgi:acyl-CoA thioester hydrolase/1,4-dihydroxy-2-naphthoyl-CoA hydrolase
MTFETEIQIRFRQADPAGILFFGEIFSLAHDCFEEFISETGIGWKTWFHTKDYLVPIRHTDCNYLKPFFAGEKYQIKANVLKFGETSFQMQYVFSKANNIHAKVTMAHAFLDAKTKQKIPVPEQFKLKLSPYLVKA